MKRRLDFTDTLRPDRSPVQVATLPESVKQADMLDPGHTRPLVPADHSWDAWFDGEGVSEDFMSERDQPGPL